MSQGKVLDGQTEGGGLSTVNHISPPCGSAAGTEKGMTAAIICIYICNIYSHLKLEEMLPVVMSKYTGSLKGLFLRVPML